MKKFLSILMTLMLMMGMISVLGACSKDDAVAEEVPEEEVAEEDEEIYEDADAEYEAMQYLSTDSITHERPHFYLIRDEEYFSLDNTFRIKYAAPEGGLYANDDGSFEGLITQCTLYGGLTEFTNGKVGFTSYGKITVPVLKSSDEVVSSFAREVPSLRLFKLTYHGDALPIILIGPELHIWNTAKYGIRDFMVTDSDGNVCEDYYDLESDVTYNMSWYEGSSASLSEESIICTSKSYTFEPKITPEVASDPFNSIVDLFDYEIEPSSVDGQLARYDLSGVAPGLYRIGNNEDTILGGVIEVK